MTDNTGDALTVDRLVAMYGPEALVRPKKKDIPLGAALAMEAAFCEGDPARRQDEVLRVRNILGMLAAAGTPLLTEHQHLLEPLPDAGPAPSVEGI